MLASKGNPEQDTAVSSSVPATKEKKRKSEKRKEKSRDAARCRRSRESEIFQELSEELPICLKTVSHLDKASLVRIAISYLKIRHLFSTYKGFIDKKDGSNSYDSFYLPSIDGFILIMSRDGDMVYLSENVHKYLGISQVDLIGHSIFEYSHPCDHDEVREVLQRKLDGERQGPFSIFVRMKCALSQKGKNINMRSASFKVIHCTGHLLRCVSLKPTKKGQTEGSDSCLVSLGEPVPHPSNIEVPLDQQSFLSRHSLDMKFTYVDQRMTDVLGYKSEDIMGKSVYLFYHACDASFLEKSFKILFSKGQSETGRYRFLAKRGGFVWLLTQATLIYESGSSKPQCVVCINYVLSGQEKQEEVVSVEQVAACKMPLDSLPESKADTTQEEEKGTGDQQHKEEEERQEQEEVVVVESKDEEEVCLPQANTIKIFAPRTADMNKGFLTFDDDSGRTVLKEEPEDLTHLAPQAGDVCFPLDMSISYPDLIEDAFLPCSLDVEQSSSISDLESLHSSNCFREAGCSSDDSEISTPVEKSLKSPLTNDPFLCLREDEGFSSDYGIGLSHRQLLKGSDKLLFSESKKVKDFSGSMGDSSKTCRAENLDIQDDCLSDCAPYIPLNDDDDFTMIPASSLLLETALDAESNSFDELEENVPLPLGPIKLLKRERTVVLPLNGSSANGMIKLSRNDLHSDGSSEYLDEYDSDPLESDINDAHFPKTQTLYVNPNSVFQSSVLKHQTKASQQNLFHKQSQVFERRRPDIIDPGDDNRVLLKDVGAGRDIVDRAPSVERKQSTLSLLDPSPKRNGPHHLQLLESPKKMRIDPTLNQSKAGAQGSVLLNLLVRGEDASHGYLCPANQSDHLKYKLLPEATVIEKPLNTQPKLSHAVRGDVRSNRRAHNLVL